MIRVSEATLDAFRLSPKEREVVLLFLGGKRIKQIAAELFLGPETIGTHMDHIREKTGAHDGAGIVCALWQAEQEAAEKELAYAKCELVWRRPGVPDDWAALKEPKP